MIENGKCYFLSRPRRFGKSLLMSTIHAIFDGKRELFEGLAIADKPDMDWVKHQEYLGRKAVAGPTIVKPDSFETMKEIAQSLSAPHPFVRVDFYEVNGKPVFGEMTFTPGMQETSNSFSEMIGAMINLG